MIPAVRRHNLVVKIVLIAFVGTSFLIGCALMAFSLVSRSGQTADRTDDWPAFYKQHVEGSFNIPREAEILVAEEHKDFLMGGGYLLSFRLPETKKPEEWLKVVLKDTALLKHKKTPHRYDGSGQIGDEHWIEYRPADRTYVARWGWD